MEEDTRKVAAAAVWRSHESIKNITRTDGTLSGAY